MSNLDPFIQDVKKLTLHEFAAKYSHPFLIVHGQRPLDSDEELAKDTDLESTGEARSDISIYPVKEQSDSSAFGFMTIGRSVKNHIVMSSRMVSKIHAIIHKIQDTYTIVDANSNNGTKLNNQTLSPNIPHLLHDGDTVILAGRVLLQFLVCSSAYKWLQDKAGDPMLTPGE